MGATALLAMVAALAAGVWMWGSTRHEPFEHYTITQATNTGTAINAAISPDGKFIMDVQRGPDGPSLWLRNVDTGSHTQVVPPQPVGYGSVVFSPDGNSCTRGCSRGGPACSPCSVRRCSAARHRC